jgi:hypothetical protein
MIGRDQSMIRHSARRWTGLLALVGSVAVVTGAEVGKTWTSVSQYRDNRRNLTGVGR